MTYKLCYIEKNFAYFTTQDLEKQWGDDWDDAPYEHNAGTPYEPRIFYYADGRREKDLTEYLHYVHKAHHSNHHLFASQGLGW